ncbi:conserved hypothetical protein [Gluconacetobacter diazotrophicus PA1 5]|uniref:Uncharacterized protein n=2 Tax=Gluconacetobacter diazotrophicus TaxID=33996 RepID=A9HHK0_GLUDA|nr:DUF6468 domain-containing protein [Gluconacetobacter diazotrophicus]ACI53206.1 conserved hypothetical protein [Gluconacetobacter diazotrophicus PA1 5]MBB2156043.1 hypothetical protein [Gluconacetobacter diazotrophicus]TWB10420.1 hypothetical protein FBZ86_102161 [Gluconacetobacter diazotrophicus]CAP55644.1 conserved hypothetical protein [Gluconacetobacter diazotrophicus PA1 5]
MLTQIQMIIEIILSFFLLLGIIYSLYFSRVLSNLKRDRESLLGLVEKLQSSVKSAEEGVEKLRIAGEVSGRPLSRMIEQAKMASTELDTMVSKADSMADRLQGLATKIPSQERRLEDLLEKTEETRLELVQEARNLRYPDCSPELTSSPHTPEAEDAGSDQDASDKPDSIVASPADATVVDLEEDTPAEDKSPEDKPTGNKPTGSKSAGNEPAGNKPTPGRRREGRQNRSRSGNSA